MKNIKVKLNFLCGRTGENRLNAIKYDRDGQEWGELGDGIGHGGATCEYVTDDVAQR